MRVLAVLWTVCLVRLCSAGCCGGGTRDDDDGPYGGSTENLRSSPSQSSRQDGVALDLSNPDESKLEIRESVTHGVSYRGFIPKSGYHTNKVKDGGKELWKAEAGEKYFLAQSYTKGNEAVLYLEISGSSGTTHKYFEKVDGKWDGITQGDFLKKLHEMRNGVTNQPSVESSQESPNPPKAPTQPEAVPPGEESKEEKVLTQPTQESTPTEPKEEPEPVSPLASKVDSTLFDVSESNSDGVPLLTCTPKPNIVVTEFKYGDDTIWKNSRGSCLSALIYFDEDKPEVVTLQYRAYGKDRTIFLHYNGDEWEDNQEEYAKKLNILKGVPPPATQSTVRVNTTLDLLNPDVESVHVGGGDEDGLAKRVFTPNDGFAMTKVVIRGDLIWKAKRPGEKCTLVESYSKGESMLAYLKLESATGLDLKYLERVNGEWKEVTITEFYQKLGGMRKKKEESPEEEIEIHLKRAKKRLEESESAPAVAKSSGNTNANREVSTPKSPTPITLDLSNPDNSKIKTTRREDNGIAVKEYVPKDPFYISSVMDGDKEVWKPASEKEEFVFARVSSKGDSSLLLIFLEDADNRFFEKNANGWTSIDEKDYEQKLAELKYAG
ncbi:signal peptide-containing protein [Theileria equi strain WA]|uniref:Signal peptide-containing protein n=1 Tax=Theileria equi strain WA TaxID=1537102 RepID=L0AXK5_THEEQ|nr:signal peptide-containing protein [Theileria equi strain WA]AFZ80302.1 signal peptide-containing protein [Theileria equi strain WA]|eukprot:XP_004829968.1 signal peptide-containing protein [Theileria equi strain WA]